MYANQCISTVYCGTIWLFGVRGLLCVKAFSFPPSHAAHIPQLLLLHLEGAVYHFFLQLYAMFPCNFVNYLKARYGPKGEAAVFRKHIAVSSMHVTRGCLPLPVATRGEYMEYALQGQEGG